MKRLITILIMTCALVASAQHAPIVGHYTISPLVLNPAFTGSDNAPVATGMYRTQWVGLDGAPQTQLISWSTRMRDDVNSIGGAIYRDAIGVSSRVGVLGAYAHNYRINNKLELSLGVSGGVAMFRNRWSQISTTDQYDNAFTEDSPLMIAPDVSFGSLLYADDYFVSFSIPFMLTHEEHGQKMKSYARFGSMNYMVGGGYKMSINPDVEVQLSSLLKLNPTSTTQIDITPSVTYKNQISAGVSYRSGDAFIVLLGYQVNDQFYAGYNYDITLSNLSIYSNGSHELFLSYRFKYALRTESPRFF